MLKKKLIMLATAVGMIMAVSACSKAVDTVKETVSEQVKETVAESVMETEKEQNDMHKKVVVTTSFLEDMVNQIAGDSVDIELIIPAGEDPHLYVAKPEDYNKLDEADLVLYHGLHFEGKMIEALEAKGVSLSDNFPADKLGQMDEDGHMITDPHFWFNLDLYKLAVSNASEALIELVPDMEDEYVKKTNEYLSKLDDLDAYIKENINMIPKEHRYLITPHDAFNYFSAAYDIEVKAPQGVSTETEVSNNDIEETIDFIVEHQIKAVFAESTTDPARMEKLKEGAKAKGHDVMIVSGEGNELFSDSLAPKGHMGDTFIDMYKHNVDLIVENLK